MSAASDRNLLFGVLALQIDAITADQLIQGMHGWVADKSRTLGELLLEQGSLGRDQFTALEALVGARIRMFDNDPTESLAHLSSAGAVARLLCRVQDRELDASLQVMGAEREPNRDNDTVAERSHGYQRRTGSSTDGRFRIQRLHDEGGLGRVFVAEDTELGRQVALKELKETIAHDSASRTRFLTEAEITGGLEHPGIVPVYGLGHYDDGRPFYAMRFIQGDNLQVKIREYHETDWSKHGGVSAKSIELRRLLGRFIDVCEAIHYAHKRGVLHRDLKPGNIMAGRYGETLVVDWGLAKWLGQRKFASPQSSLDEEATLLPPSGSHASATRLGSAVGTPAFMSPEQARGEHDRLGPATDIYGLGATLYMLLTNHRPYEGEVDVLAAACRGALARPRSVNPSIPKPLESICLRAMAFQPHERYPSAQELAADVEQFLGDEPVTAYREGLSEQARRWLRKHSTLAATLLGIGLMAVVLLLVVGRLYQQLDEERQRKESVIDLMVRAFQRTDPNQDGRTVTVAQVLDDTVNEMGNSDIDDSTKTELLYAIGRSYHNLGLYDQAINVLNESQRRASKLLGEDHLYSLHVASAMGELCRQTGQYAKSIEMHKECLAQFRRLFGEKDRITLRSLNNLAAAYEGESKEFDMAIPLFEQLLEQRREVLGSKDEDTLMSAVNLAKTYSDAGRETDAANMYLDSELEDRIKRCFGEDHTATKTFYNNRAAFFYSTHRLDQALTSFRSLLEFRRRVLGPEHPDTLASMHNLGRCLESLGQLEEAESLYRGILNLVGDKSEAWQHKELKALQSVQLQQRKYSDALTTIAQWQDAMSDHPELSQKVPMARISQAEALLGLGRAAEALAILRTTVPQLVESRPTWLETQRGQGLLGSALALTDDQDQSAELMLKAFQSLRIQLPEIDPHYRWYVARAAEHLVELYRARKNVAQTSIWEQELARVDAEIVRLRNETPE